MFLRVVIATFFLSAAGAMAAGSRPVCAGPAALAITVIDRSLSAILGLALFNFSRIEEAEIGRYLRASLTAWTTRNCKNRGKIK